MAEKDASARLRRAIKEGNLFLVKRLIQRTDMRNTDPGAARYTSLAWAAYFGHEQCFDFLLANGHDDEELSKDADNNTILILLAGLRSGGNSPYNSSRTPDSLQDAALRMARAYQERFPFILDWSNSQGKTALHMAALKGNEEFVAMLCELHADVDLPDVLGNTPLHYASAWGHLSVMKLLIEHGCQFVARNNEGYTPSDYAYSHHTKETLEDSARAVHDARRNARRQPYAQMRGLSLDEERPLHLRKDWKRTRPRLRSGSGTTTTSESADELAGQPAYSHSSVSPTPATSSQPSGPSSTGPTSRVTPPPRKESYGVMNGQSDTPRAPPPSQSAFNGNLGVAPNTHIALSPVASRVLASDADAMAEYMKRNRSGSQSDSSRSIVQASSSYSASYSTSNTAINNATPPIKEEPIAQKYSLRRLRPSLSAATLRTQTTSSVSPVQSGSSTDIRSRFRAGTNPSPGLRPQLSPHAPPSSEESSDRPSPRRAVTGGTLPSLPEPSSTVPAQRSPHTSPPALPPKDDRQLMHRRGPSVT